MAERTFEMELDRLFAEAPVLQDAEQFAFRITSRLDRGWTFRQVLIGGLGLVGGLIGGAQILGSGVLARLGTVSAESNHLVSSRLSDLAAAGFLPAGGEVLWMSAALAILAAGFALTHAVREI